MSKSSIVLRELTKEVSKGLKHFPFVSITGPRQSGKTTICHLIAQGYQYINLEIDKHKQFAEKDPEGFLEKYNYKVILDEVQKVPTLFPYLMAHTDLQRKNGAYILSGSQNILLMQSITQSLAGRIAIFSLLPFSYSEMNAYLSSTKTTWESIVFRGFFPRLFVEKKMNPSIFYSSYIKTYLNKDISQLANIHNIRTFKKFIELLAIRAGSVLNLSNIANDLNIDRKTVQKWVSYLETSYIIYLLPSYHTNFEKRILKADKIYFTDTGILCFLLGIKSEKDLSENTYAGNIFENFIIIELLKNNYNKGDDPSFYYWQDSNKKEVDLIIENGENLEIIEIKTSSTPKIEFAKNLISFSELAIKKGYKIKSSIIYTGSDNYKQNGIHFLPWKDAL